MKEMVDLITNSFSEIFIGSKKHDINEVKKILQTILDAYNETQHFIDKTVSTLKFDDVFGDIYIAKTNSDAFFSYGLKIKKGDFIIESNGDNSIPYELFDIIESTFKTYHHHIG